MHNPISCILLQDLCKDAVDELVKAAAYLGEPFDKANPAGIMQTVHTQSQVILKTLSEIKVCGFVLLMVTLILMVTLQRMLLQQCAKEHTKILYLEL